MGSGMGNRLLNWGKAELLVTNNVDDLREIAGVESFMVPRAEQHTEIGSDVFFGGSVLPSDASVHPALYHAGLMQRIEERGGVIAGQAAADDSATGIRSSQRPAGK